VGILERKNKQVFKIFAVGSSSTGFAGLKYIYLANLQAGAATSKSSPVFYNDHMLALHKL